MEKSEALEAVASNVPLANTKTKMVTLRVKTAPAVCLVQQQALHQQIIAMFVGLVP